MREWRNARSGMLQTLLWETRLIYTIFLLFCFISYLLMGLLMASRTGFSTQELTDYYIGNEEKELYGKSFQELMEITHFHLFSIPLLLFIQGHLFLLTSWPKFIKVGIVLGSFLGAILSMSGPWLIIYFSPKSAILMVIGRVFLFTALTLYFFVPIYEMWLKKKPPKN